MEFILQLVADLLLPDDTGAKSEVVEEVVEEKVSGIVTEAEEKITESPNIFGLMEFH
jgi:hypothetical protein